MSTTPSLNAASFRLSFEPQIAKLPPEHQTVIRSQMNAFTDIYQAFDALNTKVNTLKTSVSSAASTASSTSSTTKGVTAGQAANIALQTIQSTLNGINNQTGTSYKVLNSDYQKIVTMNNAASVAVTLGGDGTGVGAQFGTFIENLGAGTATLTPASGTINGTANITLVTNQSAFIAFDGTNWGAATSAPGSGGTITSVIAGTGLTGGGSSGAVTLALVVPVSIADGGTGTATPGLVAGTGISVTGTWPDQTIAATTGGVTQITAGSNVTISPVGGTGNVTVNAIGTAYTVALVGVSLGAGQAQTGTTVHTAPSTAVLMCSLYDPTSPGANQFLSAFAYNQNGTIEWSVTNVSPLSVTVLSSTVLNIRVFA